MLQGAGEIRRCLRAPVFFNCFSVLQGASQCMCIFVHSPKAWYCDGIPLPGGKVPSKYIEGEVPGEQGLAKEKDIRVDWMRDGPYLSVQTTF